jgi:hypothetical protein
MEATACEVRDSLAARKALGFQRWDAKVDRVRHFILHRDLIAWFNSRWHVYTPVCISTGVIMLPVIRDMVSVVKLYRVNEKLFDLVHVAMPQ